MATTKLVSNHTSESRGLNGRKFSKAKEIAFRLGICTRTVFRWADEGRIKRHKINARMVLFDENEVASLLDSSRID